MTGNLDRRAVVEALMDDRGDMVVVGGLGAPAWDITAAGDHDLNFPLWGAMGGAAMLGLGLALAQPTRRVLVVTGDGEQLMGLSALSTIGSAGVSNLAIAVLDNERYGETGMQHTNTASGTDISGVALACGFPVATTAATESESRAAVAACRDEAGPVLAVFKIAADVPPQVVPPRDGALLVRRFRAAVGVEGDSGSARGG